MLSEHPRRHEIETELQELTQWIAETPTKATVKGMYIDSFLKTLDGEQVPRPTNKRHIAFRDYSLRDFMRLMLESTVLMTPNRSPREGLRLIGRLAYPTFSNSTVGRIMFALAGRNWNAALPLASRAYEVSLSPGRATLVNRTPKSATLELRDVWNFADCYQVGVLEGAMQTFHVDGEVNAITRGARCDVDLLMNWV